MIPGWCARFIGAEFEARGRGPRYDCWGMARAVWQEQFGLDVPSYAEGYATTNDREEIAALIRGALGPWRPVALEEARAGDGLLLRMQGEPMHVGVIVAPGRFLHVIQGANACLDDYRRPQWARRVLGVYRHEALARG